VVYLAPAAARAIALRALPANEVVGKDAVSGRAVLRGPWGRFRWISKWERGPSS
jgi:hypothetical protein